MERGTAMNLLQKMRTELEGLYFRIGHARTDRERSALKRQYEARYAAYKKQQAFERALHK
jgi:hypothetical protein